MRACGARLALHRRAHRRPHPTHHADATGSMAFPRGKARCRMGIPSRRRISHDPTVRRSPPLHCRWPASPRRCLPPPRQRARHPQRPLQRACSTRWPCSRLCNCPTPRMPTAAVAACPARRSGRTAPITISAPASTLQRTRSAARRPSPTPTTAPTRWTCCGCNWTRTSTAPMPALLPAAHLGANSSPMACRSPVSRSIKAVAASQRMSLSTTRVCGWICRSRCPAGQGTHRAYPLPLHDSRHLGRAHCGQCQQARRDLRDCAVVSAHGGVRRSAWLGHATVSGLGVLS